MQLKIVFKYRTLVTFTSIYALFFLKWANTNWLFSTPWKLWFWFKTNWFKRCQVVIKNRPIILCRKIKILLKQALPGCLNNHASPKTDWLYSVLPIITLQLNKNSSSNIKHHSTHMLKPHRVQQSTLEKCIQWHKIWMKCWHRRLRKLQVLFKRPWQKDRIGTGKVCQWLN